MIEQVYKKIIKDIDLNNTINKIDLFDIYRISHPFREEYTFFLNLHRTFTKIDNIWGYKTSSNRIKRIQAISGMFSDHNGVKLKIHSRKISGKSPITWKLNNIVLNNPHMKQEIKEIRKYFELNKNEKTTYKNLVDVLLK